MRTLGRLVNWYFRKESLPYWCVLFIDCAICYVSGLLALRLFFSTQSIVDNFSVISITLLFYLIFSILGFRLFHTYSGIIRYSSFIDLERVVRAMGLSFLCAFIVHYPIMFYEPIQQYILPLHTRHLLAIYILSTALLCTFRVLVKALYDSTFANNLASRTLIYGVKEGGVGIAKLVNNQKPQRFKIFGFITHDKKITNHYLMGTPVFQVDDELEKFIRQKRITVLLVSPIQNKAFREDSKLQDLLLSCGVHIFMFGDLTTWDANKAADELSHLKEVSIEELLPRDEIQVDLDKVRDMLHNKNVLITGSAGSIGSEIVRQVASFHPAKMMLIDQAETPQHDIRLMMKNDFPDVPADTVVTTITNQSRMERIFADFKPDYVYHAAAYKHVPMMEDNPCESIQNNVWGTKILADLSVKYGVKKFVMISTDKAVNPTNVMGCSKRICEIYVQSLDKAEKDGQIKGQTQFVTTRFGNVLGSNGSVIPLFMKQIAKGGPVTVTDPNIFRFFMLIPEACELVLEAGTHGEGGEIFVFDMGKPVRIADLAKRMIRLSGATNVEIKYTGLRPGEKLYEEVLSNSENSLPSFHEKIKIAKVREYDYAEVEQSIEELYDLSKTYDDMAVVGKMKDIVPEYTSPTSVYGVLDKKS